MTLQNPTPTISASTPAGEWIANEDGSFEYHGPISGVTGHADVYFAPDLNTASPAKGRGLP